MATMRDALLRVRLSCRGAPLFFLGKGSIMDQQPHTESETEAKQESSTQKEQSKLASVIKGGKKPNKKVAIAVCAAVVLIIAFGIFHVVSSSSPFVGKWYTDSSTDPVIEIKSDGTAVISKNPEASVTWEKLENGNIKVSTLDLSNGKAKRTSYTLDYGKTNNGIEYIDDGETLLFKSYDDAQKIKEMSETEDGSLKDSIDRSDSSSSGSKKSGGSSSISGSSGKKA